MATSTYLISEEGVSIIGVFPKKEGVEGTFPIFFGCV